ncbi:TetR/AcrR family transcriptional regulator [Nocardia sp. CA-107356]|uniref:TetR/AcrR family transcriptional regulator n=1 Tax=Nocardia sp. CA-107356 TaxID=3239972 RepID=UPI003D8B364E
MDQDANSARSRLKVTQPRQARSRATMERILSTVEDLLAEKPFEQITIAEISARSASAPTAIYARFSDKTALLLGVHERFRERTADKIVAAITEPGLAELPPEEFVSYVAGELIALFRDNHRLLRSVLLSNNSQMYTHATELGRSVATAIGGQLSPRIPEHQRADAERDLDFAVRTALALMQQSLIFDDQTPTRFDYSEAELRDRITRILFDAYTRYSVESPQSQ